MSMSLYAVTFDGTNAAKLARFWPDVLGRPVDDDPSEEFRRYQPRRRITGRAELDVQHGLRG